MLLASYPKEVRQFELKSRRMTKESNGKGNTTNPVCGEEKKLAVKRYRSRDSS